MNLYPHNQQAYEAIMKCYSEGKRKAAVVHATGTGKSYIIGAVSAHFDKVIVIAPNHFVLNEARKVCKDNVEFKTYASVMYDEEPRSDYDLIVLDEFHRSGAEKWGVGVSNLIDANPNAKLLGTSATHIRYLDHERNMADEMFDENVVSYLSLKDAIDKGILPNPTYVSSVYSLTDDVAKRKQRILSCKKTDEWKEEKIRHLKGLASNWDNADGVPRIIRKYFDKDMQRVIVFCAKVSKASQARKWLGKWFGLAGFKRIRFYNIDYTEQRLVQEMSDFQEPVEDGCLKVAISVNMLNEGVHIPRVDGIIMLRSTMSRNIIEQQIGRCLTADNKHRTPVVIDLVNNMDRIKYDTPEFTGEWDGASSTASSNKKSDSFPFTVIDECRDIRAFFMQLDEDLDCSCLQYYFEACKTFYAENGRLPNRKDNKQLGQFLNNLRIKHRYFNSQYKQYVIDELTAMGYSLEIRDSIGYEELNDRIRKYVSDHGYRPCNDCSEGQFLYNRIKKMRHRGLKQGWTSEQVQSTLNYLDSIPSRSQVEFQQKYDFVKKVLPTIEWFSSDYKDVDKNRCQQIVSKVQRRKFTWDEEMYDKFNDLITSNPRPNKSDLNKDRVLDFVKKNNRLPLSRHESTPEQRKEHIIYRYFRRLYLKGDKDILRITEQYGYNKKN